MSIAGYAADRFNYFIRDFEHPESCLDPEDIESIVYSKDLTHFRWTKVVKDVFRMVDGSYLAVQYEVGLTEIQEDTDPCATAYEVVPRTVETVVYVRKEWTE
ncbi:hypothetical protein [Actinopolyspora erythraea]|uniref:hypothetical protein n=1 Tax=Actinopolyspora erythraea TaxID=414996 RepID=UPI0005BBDF82|nr:hypothetical protein [Actinopolyspora erythraea]